MNDSFSSERQRRSVRWDTSLQSKSLEKSNRAQSTPVKQPPAPSSTGKGSVQGLSHFQKGIDGNSMSAVPTTSHAQTIQDVASGPVYTRPALKGRLRWNATALVVFVIGQRLPLAKRFWWSILDSTYRVTGSDLDVTLNTFAEYFSWVLMIIFTGNLIEALIRYNFGSSNTASSAAQPAPPKSLDQGLLLSNSIRSSPKTRPSAAAPMPFSPSPRRATPDSSNPARPGSTPVQSVRKDSPLRQSILAASRSAAASRQANAEAAATLEDRSFDQSFSSSFSASSGSGLYRRDDSLLGASLGRRLPSAGPAFGGPPVFGAPRASPSALDAFKARNFSSSSSVGDSSFVGDVSAESFEVERALRKLSASINQPVSQKQTARI